MALEKEALTHKIEDDLAARNRNWDKIEAQLAEIPSYEDGEFTPTVVGGTTAGTGTYSTRKGNYVRVGRLVFITISLAWTAHTGTGELRVEGLPFVAASLHYNALSMTADNLTFSGQVVPRLDPSSARIAFRCIISGSAAARASVSSDASIYIAGTYLMA